MSSVTTGTSQPVPVPRPYIKAIGPRLQILFRLVMILLALLGANSFYMGGFTFLGWLNSTNYEDQFYHWMGLTHVLLGFLMILPFLIFGACHIWNTRYRKNKRAIRVGYFLFVASLIVLLTGVLLVRLPGIDIRHPTSRRIIYWVHVIGPLVAGWLYWLHRLAGPKIRWKVGAIYALVVLGGVGVLAALHLQDPRDWNVVGPKDGAQYFHPSRGNTATGNFIPAETLMMDDYCKKCHPDVHEQWSQSAHRFSSFNNPFYLASVRETRKVGLERHGNVKASRFCAGCHDPVPFFSGAFDDPEFDDVKHETAHAGITCTTCHAISSVENPPRGNGGYTIEEPIHYPFAYSSNPVLQFINNQLIKAKPEFHKRTFLKPLHKSAEFCATCHKVHLPEELNDYKWLRGQNHYDPFLLSGVSGHGARSFYYPPQAQVNCNECHMPRLASNDFGAKEYQGSKELQVHDHLFPSANTALPYLRDRPEIVEKHRDFLQGIVRVDLFGIREGGEITGKLIAPLRPSLPELEPGKRYLLEAVVRTVKMGHLFTQGTADSNEVWLEVTVKSGDRIIGKSGGLDPDAEVDPWSHFLNVFMLDKNGNRIDRRNAQDIFIPLYNHQIPPGAAATVHYGLDVPEGITEPLTVTLELKYRKFDKIYVEYASTHAKKGDLEYPNFKPGEKMKNSLPIVLMARDEIVIPVKGGGAVENKPSPIDEWQRWNDYGIGLYLKGKAEFRQAIEAFEQVEKLNRFDGPLNLARVHFDEGELDDAVNAIERASQFTDPAPYPWTRAWLTGLINRQQGNLAEAEESLYSALFDDTEERRKRGFDFSKDYEVLKVLGDVIFERAQQDEDREATLDRAIEVFDKVLELDSEDFDAHYGLMQIYKLKGDAEKAAHHEALHAKYKPDDNARDRAFAAARKKYPAADHAAEAVVIYSLHREGAPELEPQKAPARTGEKDNHHE